MLFLPCNFFSQLTPILDTIAQYFNFIDSFFVNLRSSDRNGLRVEEIIQSRFCSFSVKSN